MSNQTINNWEQPVAEQARANPRPMKPQGERSMRFEARYGAYAYPEQIIRLEREAAAKERSAQAKRDRAFKKEWNARATIVFLGSAPSKSRTKAELAAEKKAKREELLQMEREEAIARLAPYTKMRSTKNRIGKAS